MVDDLRPRPSGLIAMAALDGMGCRFEVGVGCKINAKELQQVPNDGQVGFVVRLEHNMLCVFCVCVDATDVDPTIQTPNINLSVKLRDGRAYALLSFNVA